MTIIILVVNSELKFENYITCDSGTWLSLNQNYLRLNQYNTDTCMSNIILSDKCI